MCASALAQRSLRHRSLRSHKPPSSSSDRRRPEKHGLPNVFLQLGRKQALATRHRCNSTSWSARSSCLIVLLHSGPLASASSQLRCCPRKDRNSRISCGVDRFVRARDADSSPLRREGHDIVGHFACENKITASAKSPSSGSPVREKATAPAFAAARDRARATAADGVRTSSGSIATSSPASSRSKPIAT